MFEKGFETRRVKFFDAREGKRYGFLESEGEEDIFFHHNDGEVVASGTEGKVICLISLLRDPRKGDTILFERAKGKKGPKACPWVFKENYESAQERSRRPMTTEEASQYLRDKSCSVLEFEEEVRGHGGTATIKTVTKITWFDQDQDSDSRLTIATGEFSKLSKGSDRTDRKVGSVFIYRNGHKYTDTHLTHADALALKSIGQVRGKKSGRKVTALWNGGWDDYVIDANNVRPINTEDLRYLDEVYPSFEVDGTAWLQCSFIKNLGSPEHVVEVIAYLDHGD